MPIYYLGFKFAIKQFDIKTPGRESGEIKMFTKADYKKIKEHEQKKEDQHKATVDDKFQLLAADVILAYGGSENIVNVDACITKLRVQVKDQSKVDGDKLRKLGAAGIIKPSPQSVYAVFGTTADTIKNKMNEILFPDAVK
jgi:glucose-like phosphotransferase system IIB component